jgi:hypothetical protein
MLGGETQQNEVNCITGYSKLAQLTGKPAYLDSNSQSLQKNRRGEGSLLTLFHANSMLKTRTYLEPNRNSMQKPIEGLFSNAENVGGRVAIGEKQAQKHVEKRRLTPPAQQAQPM